MTLSTIWKQLLLKPLTGKPNQPHQSKLQIVPLEDRITPAPLDIMANLAFTGNQTWDSQVRVFGNRAVSIDGDLTINQSGFLIGDSDSGTLDNLELRVTGNVIINGLIGGQGLNDVNIVSDKGITVNYTGTIGANTKTIDITGDLGFVTRVEADFSPQNLSVFYNTMPVSSEININNARIFAANVNIDSRADGSKYDLLTLAPGADGTLDANRKKFNNNVIFGHDATGAFAQRQDPGNFATDGFVVGMEVKVKGSIGQYNDKLYIVAGVSPDGKKLYLTETEVYGIYDQQSPSMTSIEEIYEIKDSDKVFMQYKPGANPGDPPVPTGQTISNDDLVGFNAFQLTGGIVNSIVGLLVPVRVVNVDAQSTVTVGGNTRITSNNDLSIMAKSFSAITSSVYLGGVTVGKGSAKSNANILTGAILNAGKNFSLTTEVDNDISISRSGLIPVPTISRLALAYAMQTSHAITTVNNGSTINGGNVAIKSVINNNAQVRMAVGELVDSSSAIGISGAIVDQDSISRTIVNGTVNATAANGTLGDLEISSLANNEERLVNTTSEIKTAPSIGDKIKGYIGKKAVNKKPIQAIIGLLPSSLKDKINTKVNNPASAPEVSSYDAAGAFSLLLGSNSAETTIGSTANVNAQRNAAITSRANDLPRLIALANSDASAKLSIGGAVGIQKFSNTANTTFQTGARVNALGTMDVDSQAISVNPAVAGGSLFINLATLVPRNWNTGSLNGTQVITDQMNPVSAFMAQFLSSIDPIVNLGTRIAGVYNGAPEIWASSFVAASASAVKVPDGVTVTDNDRKAISGSIEIQFLDNSARTDVQDGVLINQDPGYQPTSGNDQHVNVKANSEISQIKTIGIYDLSKLVLPSTDGGNAAVGGNIAVLDARNTAVATIGDNAKVNASGDVNVRSNTYAWMVGVSSGGGASHGFTLKGTVGYNDFTNVSTAFIEDHAQVTAGRNIGIFATNKDFAVIVAATYSIGADVGIGVGIGLNFFNNTTKAFFGNVDNPNGILLNGFVTAGNNVNIEADSKVQLINIGVAGALTKDAPPDASVSLPDAPIDGGDSNSGGNSLGAQPEAMNKSQAQSLAQSRGGVSISGNAVVNEIQDVTHAYSTGNVTATAGDVIIKATNDGFAVNVSGAGALSTTSANGGISIAGSFSLNDWKRDILAYADGGSIVAGGATIINAKSDDDLYTVTAGAAGGTRGSAVGGSVSVNLLDSTVKATTNNVTITSGGVVNVDASSSQNLLSVSGAVAVSGAATGAGVGAGVEVGILDNDIQAVIGNTSTVTSTSGNVTVNAKNETDVVSVAASVVASKNMGFSGTVATQNIDNTVKAIAGGTITADRHVLIDSRDDVKAVVVGGQATFGSKAGVGVTVANVNIDRVQESSISPNATVIAKGNGAMDYLEGDQLSGQGVMINADAIDTLIVVGAGGAGGANAGIAGSAAVTTIDSDIDAFIGANAQVNMTGTGFSDDQSVQIRANETTNVVTVAGAIAGSTKAGIGAALNVSVIDKDVQAYIDDSADVSAKNDVTVNASNNDSFIEVAAGFGGSGNVGLAGSAVVQTNNTTTKAFIDNGATVSAEGNVVVQALKLADYVETAGSVAVAGSVAFGLSNTTLVKTDVTEASINAGATVRGLGTRDTSTVYTGKFDNDSNPTTTAMKGVAVTAIGQEKIVNVAAGAAVSTGPVGAAGSAAVLVLNTTTKATVAPTATINSNNATANTDQSVIVIAADRTSQTGVGGAAAGGGTAGVGAGVTVSTITKVTEATVGGTINAMNNVIVNALAEEKLVTVGGAIAVGGSVGVAGSVSVNTLNQTTRANIADSAVVNAEGSVAVTADDQTNVAGISGNAAVGGNAGIGAAAGVFVQTKLTEAVIGNGASVTAKANKDAITGNLGTFENPVYSDPTGAEGEVTSPALSNDVATDSQAVGKIRSVTPTTGAFKGVLVTATNRDSISTVAASGAAAGVFSVALAAGVTVQNVTTNATVGTDAQINTADKTNVGDDQNVRIAAANDHYHLGVGGAVSGSGVASGSPAADVAVIKHFTKATVGNGADIASKNDVTVLADNNAEILSIAAGLAVSGTAAMAGAVSVTNLSTATQAIIGNNTVVDAEGNVIVNAIDVTETDAIAGAGAIGISGGGVGGAVAVVNISKDTLAKIGTGANIDAKANTTDFTAYTGNMDANGNFLTVNGRGVQVQAYSREDVFNVAASGAGGFYGGLSGAVIVTSTGANTQAIIDSNSVINSDTTGEHAEQSVFVNAANDVKLESYSGSLGVGGFGGISGGVDVGLIRNSVNAQIGNGANVNAENDVDVHAIANRDLTSLAISAAAGAVGIAGAVSVYAIGGGAGQDGLDSIDSNSGNGATVGGYVDQQTSQDDMRTLLNGYENTPSTGTRPNANNLVNASSTDANASMQANLPINSIGNAINSSALIAGTVARVGTNATLTAGDDINVTAKERIKATFTAGNGAGGAASVGGSVVVATVSSPIQAIIDDGATLRAVDDINVTSDLNSDVKVNAYGGSVGGLVGIGAQVAKLTDTSNQLTTIDTGAKITQAADVTISANANRTYTADTVVSVVAANPLGGFAAGASVAHVTVGGTTAADLNNAQIGQQAGLQVGNLNVNATNTTQGLARAIAVAGGVGPASSGADAKYTTASTVRAAVNSGSRVQITGNATIQSANYSDVNTNAIGVAVGTNLGIGVSLSRAEVDNNVVAAVQGMQFAAGGDVNIRALHNADGPNYTQEWKAEADGTASGGGVLAGNGADVDAISTTDVDTVVSGSISSSGGNISIDAKSNNDADADGKGIVIGGLAIGAILTTAQTGGSTTARTTNATINNPNYQSINVRANSTPNAIANGLAAAGGIAAGSGNDTRATDTTNTAATNLNGTINGGTVNIVASSAPQASAITLGVNAGALAVGASLANAIVTPTITAFAGGSSSTITAANLNVVATQMLPNGGQTAYAKGTASGGGLVGVNSTDVNAQNNSTVNAYIPDNSTLNLGTGAVNIQSTTVSNQSVDSSANTGGVIGVGAALGSATATSTTQAYVGKSVNLTAGALTVNAGGNDQNFARTAAGTGGVVVGSGVRPLATSTATTKAFIDNGAIGKTIDVNRGTGQLQVTAAHTGQVNVLAVSNSGGVLAGAGANMDTAVTSTVEATIGNNANVIAKDIDLIATNVAMKPDIGQNIAGTTGGLVSGAGVDSDTVIYFDTKTTIGNGANVQTTDNSQGITIRSQNVFDLHDNVSFTTGGALSGAGVESSITTTKDEATVTIASGATVNSLGTLDMYAQGTGTAKATSNSETYGAATAATGDSIVDIRPVNTININANAVVKSEYDMNMMVGTGKNFARDSYTIAAQNDTFAGSLIPLSSIDALARLKQINNINILANTVVESAGKMFLHAERLGLANMFAKAKATSWLSGLADGIDSLLGGNNADIFAGTVDSGASGTVNVNGSLRTGTKRQRSLTLNAWDFNSGTITGSTATEGVNFTSSQQQLKSSLQNDLLFAQEQLNKYGASNATLNSFYQGEVTRLQNELAEAGLMQYFSVKINNHGFNTGDAVVYNSLGGQAIQGLNPGWTYFVIKQSDHEFSLATSASNATANVSIPLVRVTGTGTSHSFTRGSTVRNFNASQLGAANYVEQYVMVAEVADLKAEAGRIDVRADQLVGSGLVDAPRDASITITNNTPAYLKLNKLLIPEATGGVYLNGDIVTSNAQIASLNQADIGTVPGFTNFSSITPFGTANDPTITITQNSHQPDGQTYSRPAILVTGNIDNLSGNLTITNNVPQGDVTITAQVRAKNQTVNAGGSVFIDNVTSYSVGGEAYPKWNNVTSLSQTFGYPASPIFVGITNQINNQINNVLNQPLPSTPNMYGDRIVIRAEYLNVNGLIQSGRDGVDVTIGAATQNEIDTIKADGKIGLIRLATASTADADIFFNTILNRIEVSDLQISGGYVDINANILNTGKGEIRVLGGYGKMNINNQTTYDVQLNRVDVSTQGQGKIILNDKAKGTTQIYDQHTAGSYTYNPKNGLRYGWTVGQEKFTRTTTTYGKAEWLGIDALAKDPRNIVEGPFTETVGVPVLMGTGPYIYTQTGGPDYAITRQDLPLSEPNDYVAAQWQSSSWYGTTRYYTKRVVETHERTLWTHNIRADRPINIRIIGENEGTVNINSPNGRVLLNGAILNTGSTTLSSNKNIESTSPAGVVGGKVVTLNSNASIGQFNPVYTNLIDTPTATLRVNAPNGQVNIAESSGNLPLDYVNASSNRPVSVSAQGSILRATNSNGTQQIVGNAITLNAQTGALGTSATPLNINTGANLRSVLNATAVNDINLVELSGDLRINSVSSLVGDVKLTIPGSAIDANTKEIRDERTIEELRDTIWTDLQLTAGTGAQNKINELITAFAAKKERDYNTYWVYRSLQANPAVYDANFQVPLSAAEETYYRTELGFDNAAIQALKNKRTTEYHDLHVMYGSLGNTFISNYTYTPTQAERDQIAGTVRVYTEDQLYFTIAAGLLKNVTDTQTAIEEPNITGKKITVNAGTDIGNTDGSVTIVAGTPLTTEQRIALAAAERSDVRFFNGSTEVFDIENPAVVITHMVIDQRDDVNINASSDVNASAGNNAFIGSEQDIRLGSLVAGNLARIKTSQGIVNAQTAATAIKSADLVLEAANGAIGTLATPITMDLTPTATITARANNDISLEEQNGNLNVLAVFSPQGTANLKAQASIVDAVQTSSAKIDALNITLNAGGTIGETTDPLEINASATGLLNARATGLIKLVETFGDMNIDQVESTSGDVELTANLSINDAVNEANNLPSRPAADIVGNNITLTAVLGGIGESGNDVDVNSANAGAGVFKSSSNLNTYVTETSGDLTITTVDTSAGYIASLLSAGKIINGNAVATATNVNSGRLKLFAPGDIGAANKPLQTTVGYIEGNSTAGSVYVVNTGAVVIGGLSEPKGLTAGGEIVFTANSPITVDKQVEANNSITMTATDHSGNGDGFTLNNGNNIVSASGDIVIRSGDDVSLPAGSFVSAAGKLTIVGDYNDADPGQGVNFTLLSTLSGPGGILIQGGTDDDRIRMGNIAANSPTVVELVGGNDTFVISGSTDQLATIRSDLFLKGGTGTNPLTVSDSGSTTGQTGSMTNSTISGFGMGGVITYQEMTTLNLVFGQGDDVFTVESTPAIPVSISGGAGNDTLNVKSISGSTAIFAGAGNDTLNVGNDQQQLAGIQAQLSFSGSTENDTINARDNGNTVGQQGTLSVNSLTGFGMIGGILFDTDEVMNLYMGQGDDRLAVTGVMPATRIEGQAGNDAIVVSSDGNTALGNLDAVTGEFTIDAGTGSNNTLVFGDRTGTSNPNVVITNNKITGLAPADINYTATGGQFNDSTGNAGVFVRGSNTGGDNVAIRSTRESSSYTVEGNAGSDAISVGNLSNSLDDIRGKLTVYGDNDPSFSASGNNIGDQDTVTFNDFDDASPNMVYEWTNETVLRTDLLQPITYRSSEQMNLNTGTSSNTVNVRSTTNSAQTNINMLAGDDTVNVDATGTASGLNVQTRGGNDAVNLRTTGTTSNTIINTAEGNDFITLSNNANINNNPGTVSGLNGVISVDAGTGTTNRLVIDDRAGGDNINVVITNNQITGLAPATINYAATGGNYTNPGSSNGIHVRGSDVEADRFLIPSTLVASTIEVEGNGGADRYEVGSTPMANNGNLDAVQGRLRLTAGANDAGRDEVFINDRAKVGRANYTINPTSVTSYILPANFIAPVPLQPVVNPLRPLFAGIDYDGTMEYLRMDGTDDVNIFNVSPSVDTEMYFDGNLLKSGLAHFGGGDYLMLDTTATTGRKIRITNVGEGSWTFTSPHKQVGFEEIERFNHVESVATGTASGASSTPFATIRDSETNALKFRVLAYENTFRGGVNVTTADVNNDGFPDLIVGAGTGRVGSVKIYDGSPDANGDYAGRLLTEFNPMARTFKSGLTVAAGDLNADGQTDLVVGSGPGSSPLVRAFNGTSLLATTKKMFNNGFYPFATTFRGGVNLAVGDINNDGYADIISGTGWTTSLGSVGTIVVNNGRTFARMKSFQPFGRTYKGPVQVAIGDINGDGIRDIVAARGRGFSPEIRFFNGTQMSTTAAVVQLGTVIPYASTLRAGIKLVSKSTTGGNPGFIERTSILVAPDAGSGTLSGSIREITWNPSLLKLNVADRFTEDMRSNGLTIG